MNVISSVLLSKMTFFILISIGCLQISGIIMAMLRLGHRFIYEFRQCLLIGDNETDCFGLRHICLSDPRSTFTRSNASTRSSRSLA